FSSRLSDEEKKFFLNTIEEYRDERIPLSTIIRLIEGYAKRFDIGYILNQTILEPFPRKLIEITDSGKGR
ncbi:hypothetical protein BVX95_01210, partial [archaeon D22]